MAFHLKNAFQIGNNGEQLDIQFEIDWIEFDKRNQLNWTLCNGFASNKSSIK